MSSNLSVNGAVPVFIIVLNYTVLSRTFTRKLSTSNFKKTKKHLTSLWFCSVWLVQIPCFCFAVFPSKAFHPDCYRSPTWPLETWGKGHLQFNPVIFCCSLHVYGTKRQEHAV